VGSGLLVIPMKLMLRFKIPEQISCPQGDIHFNPRKLRVCIGVLSFVYNSPELVSYEKIFTGVNNNRNLSYYGHVGLQYTFANLN